MGAVRIVKYIEENYYPSNKYPYYHPHHIQFFNQSERDYYSKNLSILNIAYSNLNLYLDAKILRIQEIMTLLKL